MILTCPDCKTRYVVNPAQLRPSGRVVRCAKCGSSWREEAPAPDMEEVPPVAEPPLTDGGDASPDNTEPPSSPYERPIRVRPIPRGSNLPAIREDKQSSPLLGWGILIAFVAAVLGSTYFFRDRAVIAWPPARKLYVTLGIPLTPKSLEAPAASPKAAKVAKGDLLFKDLNAVPHYEGDVLVLTFTGEIDNPGDELAPLIQLKAVAQDKNGLPLKDWIFRVEAGSVPAHGNIHFSTELRDAPSDTRRIIPALLLPDSSAPAPQSNETPPPAHGQ
jgi:predicted Zn finger-like uncharacterized protein